MHIGTTRGAVGATLLWRFRDRLHVTVALKATFAIHDGALRAVDPAPIAAVEEDYAAGLYSAGDLVPYRWKADVLVTGHASAGASAAYLGVGRGAEVLVDKAVGLVAKAGEKVPVTGLGPLSASWPVRRRLLGDIDPACLQGPGASLPESLDGAYFQAAPPDQRVDRLRGDERVVLEIEGAASDGVDLRLPGARGVAWMYGKSQSMTSGVALPLAIDTVHLDLDREVVHLVFRGWAPVPPEEEPASLRGIGRIEIVGSLDAPVSVRVPPPPPSMREPAPPPSMREPPRKPVEETIGLDAESIARMMAKAATPFEAHSPAPSPEPPPSPPEPPRKPVEETIGLDAESIVRMMAKAATPFTADSPAPTAEPPPAPPRREAPRKKPIEETIGLDAGAVARMLAEAATPFETGRELSLGDHFLVAMGLPLDEAAPDSAA